MHQLWGFTLFLRTFSITKEGDAHKHTPVFTVAWSNLPLPVPGCQLWHRYRIPYQHQGHAICFTRTAAYVNLSVTGTLPHTHTYTCACKPYLSLQYALLLLSTSFQPETNYCWSVQFLRHWCRNCSTWKKMKVEKCSALCKWDARKAGDCGAFSV